jgi:hypothetical protein
MSVNLKIKMYMTLIHSIILYGSETWALKKTEKVRLDAFERKVQRRIYGLYLDPRTGEWKIRTNEELQNIFQRPCVSREAAKRKLMWTGHACRKKDIMIKAVIEKEPIGKRPVGRPRLR